MTFSVCWTLFILALAVVMVGKNARDGRWPWAVVHAVTSILLAGIAAWSLGYTAGMHHDVEMMREEMQKQEVREIQIPLDTAPTGLVT